MLTERALHGGAFPIWLRGDSFGRHVEETAASDLFVLAHLGFFFLLLSCFALAVWSIWRRTCRPQPHVQLLMEMEEAEAKGCASAGGAAENKGLPWERPADWWKRS